WRAEPTGLTDEQARAELARLYFDWIGPASLANFRWFSGLSATAAKAATAGLDLADMGDRLLAPPTVADAFARYTAPTRPRYALLAGIDALVLLRRDHASLLDPADAGRSLLGDKPLAAVADLPDHPIVDRGRIVGLWQYDSDAAEVVWWTFEPPAGLAEAVARTGAFIRDELGDARG